MSRIIPSICLTCVLSGPVLCNELIFTVAGGGPPDGSAPLSVALGDPHAILLDSGNNIFIASPALDAVFRISSLDGTISVFAGIPGVQGYAVNGSPANQTKLGDPVGLAQDSFGNLYIADSATNRIRRVDATDGTISTVAGNGEDGFGNDGVLATQTEVWMPASVAVDSANNLYIAEPRTYRVRKVNAITGIITTVAGSGSIGSGGDGGPATSATLSNPCGLSLDSLDNLYIGDRDNPQQGFWEGNRIRMIDSSTGLITTVAGIGEKGFSGDNGPAVDARLWDPCGVILDNLDNLYIADAGNHRIRKVDAVSGLISTIAGNGTFGFGGDGDLATNAELAGPTGVALDNLEDLYIADKLNRRIRRIGALSNLITTVAGNGYSSFSGDGLSPVEAQLDRPRKIALDDFNNLYVADQGSQRIRKVDLVNFTIETVAGNGLFGFGGDGGLATDATLRDPFDVTVDVFDNLYIADRGNHRVRSVDGASGIITTIAGNGTPGFSGDGGEATSASLFHPASVVTDGVDDLYIADTTNQRIRRVDLATGIISTVAGTGNVGFSGDGALAINADFHSPWGITLDANGDLYIADTSNHRIRKVDLLTGIINTVAGSGGGFCTSVPSDCGDGGPAIDAKFDGPSGIAFDSIGNLYIADRGNSRVRMVDAITGIIQTVAGGGNPTALGDGGWATDAQLFNPFGVAVDTFDQLYIADLSNSRVRKVAAPLLVPLDILPGKCPNFIGDKGSFKVAVPGDVVAAADIELTSLALAGVPPDSCSISDKATPYFSGGQDDCIPDTRDGTSDVVCNFDTANFLLLTGLQAGQIAELELTGTLTDLTPISGIDYTEIVEGKGKGGGGGDKENCRNGVDDNGDGLADCDDPQCASKGFCRP